MFLQLIDELEDPKLWVVTVLQLYQIGLHTLNEHEFLFVVQIHDLVYLVLIEIAHLLYLAQHLLVDL
jgi:hypothetical protein